MSNLISNNPFVEDPDLLTVRAKGSTFVDFLQTIVTSLVMVIVIYLFIMTPTEVKGMSMRESVQDKDLLVSNKMIEIFGGKSSPLYFLFGDYNRGDIVVFHEAASNVDLIKRVIGISGDKLRIQDGYVYVNGTMLNETYLADGSIDPNINNRGRTRVATGQTFEFEGQEITVPEGKYFVMGDNRNNSKDSRYLEVGMLDRSDLKGKAVFRYFPLNKIGVIEGHTYPELDEN